MPKKITASQLWKEVQEVAEESPSYVYEKPGEDMCLYQHSGKPSCLVGHGLVRAGLDIEVLKKFDDGESDVEGLFYSFPEYLVKDDPGAVLSLQKAQELQDALAPWGDAVERSK